MADSVLSAPRSIPLSLFGVPVGLLGLAGAWRVGARLWDLPPAIAGAIAAVGALSWAVLLVFYAKKWWRFREAAVQEARDPVQSSFVALVWISTMLVAIAAIDVSRPAGAVLFAVSIVGQLAVGIWLIGRLWQGGQGADFATPALYLPAVGQNFVAASGAAVYGWPQLGTWLFGCGLVSWLATESVILVRAATREPIPRVQRATMGVQLAPPVVGGVAYLGLTSGPPDMAAHMLFGYGLFQAAVLLRLWAWIRQPSFSPTYWSFSFGATALPTMAMRMVERGATGALLSAVASILFVACNLMLVYLAVPTLYRLLRGRLLQPPALPGAPASAAVPAAAAAGRSS